MIFDTIRTVFRLYGYQPIETPAMENLSTLLGKYGEEGDKLLFRVLNSGDFLSDLTKDDLLAREAGKISSKISEKGLRYDLTVPFARYVVQHRDELVFPFKRYQIQPVWRADKPQKGRYREFFQCDVDVIGSDSLLNEVELIKIINEVFEKLNIGIQTKLNNRKILSGIAEYAGVPEKITDITIALDKYEKIGWDKVKEELAVKGVNGSSLDKIGKIIGFIHKSNNEKIEFLRTILSDSVVGLEGINELTELLDLLRNVKLNTEVLFDLTLARGLNYYTGAIIEVISREMSIGSICGGGRYDNLTGVFGMEGVSGVGVSFGADRIYDVMSGLQKFSTLSNEQNRIMIVNFGPAEIKYCLSILETLHKSGIGAEIYPDNAKIKKQLAYADSRKIPFVMLAGEDEIMHNEITLRNMRTGEQKTIGVGELLSNLQPYL